MTPSSDIVWVENGKITFACIKMQASASTCIKILEHVSISLYYFNPNNFGEHVSKSYNLGEFVLQLTSAELCIPVVVAIHPRE